MQLVLDTHGLVLKQRKKCFQVISETKQRLISPTKITSIAVISEVMVSSAAIRLAALNQIPIFFMDPVGNVEARLWSPHFVGLASLRRAQALWMNHEYNYIKWANDIAHKKIVLQKTHLEKLIQSEERNIERVKEIIVDLEKAERDFLKSDNKKDAEKYRGFIMGMEGVISKNYWEALSHLVPIDWKFEGRSRMPAQDPFNAALNYYYGMLYPVVESAIFAAGLDPYMGIIHVEEYDRPSLAYDLIEPFRPWVDALLFDIIKNTRVDISHFEPKDDGWWVGKGGKAILIPAFNDFLESERLWLGQKRNVKNHIYFYAGLLAKEIKEWFEKNKADYK